VPTTNDQHADQAHLSRLLVTAGPTREPIDAVRYLSNRSSGRTGIAIATEAARRNIPTTLLLGPVANAPERTPSLHIERFETTAELRHLLLRHWPNHALLIMAAAVADFIPQVLSKGKASRHEGPCTLTLEPAIDLLKEAAVSRAPGQYLVGFALEPAATCISNARAKLLRKGVDAIVANPLETMDAPTIAASLVLADGTMIEPPCELPKTQFASWLMDALAEQFPTPFASLP
jgi:phosphopantothenoylcysteine decarboxylase/phosphopantothenate--cysteine ligase